jgi:hypothetical protein
VTTGLPATTPQWPGRQAGRHCKPDHTISHPVQEDRICAPHAAIVGRQGNAPERIRPARATRPVAAVTDSYGEVKVSAGGSLVDVSSTTLTVSLPTTANRLCARRQGQTPARTTGAR